MFSLIHLKGLVLHISTEHGSFFRLDSMILYFLLFLCGSIETKSTLTLDDFFDSTDFLSLSFSPSGQYLLFQTARTVWNSSSFENNLWLYQIETQKKKLITTKLNQLIKPQWSPSGNLIAFIISEELQHFIYLYSVVSDELWLMRLNNTESPSHLTWSNSDLSLYIVSTTSQSIKEVIQYRQRMNSSISTILRIDIDLKNQSIKRNIIKHIPFLISELLYVPFNEKLIFTSISTLFEDLGSFEIYSIDLRNSALLTRLTNNIGFEIQLQLSSDGKHILFRNYTRRLNRPEFNDTQPRLYSLDLINGQIEGLGKDFSGNIIGYIPKSDGGVYILGQLGTEVHIYTQKSSRDNLIHHEGWNGSYERIASSLHRPRSIAFVYSSFEKPKEIYFIHDIDQLQSAQVMTDENYVLAQRDIPKAKVFKWKNDQDNQIIEGNLHYPPGKFQSKNLPLFVLIHGGPYEASLNDFQAGWYNWAPLAATQGWLVLEPNYCGSAGYGDQFLDEIRGQPLTRPSRDILSAVDYLIRDGIVDPNKLAIGGYSYGGFLTNWLITQTTRFNAALSGSGAVHHTSAWGTMDLPVLFHHLFSGFPWDVSHIYQMESPIYYLDKVRTPTLIVTGEKDVRVDPAQSYILERSLYYLGIPVNLIILPNEGHELDNDPWHGKIKVREELKWLQKYGHQSSTKVE